MLNKYRLAAPSRLKFVARMTAISLLSLGALRADSLATTSYNFQVDNGGGGASAILNGNTSLEIFCVDFNNDIYVPASGYSAVLTSLTSAGFNPTVTRFGEVTNWANVTISGDAADSSTINGANAFQRYQMAGYLVSLYSLPAGGNAVNSGIQEAIWTIMDPTVYQPYLPVISDPAIAADTAIALEEAAQWFSTNSQAQRDSYLQGFRIVSDTTMTAGNPLTGGFQEQITRVPEPGTLAVLAFGLIGLLWRSRRTAAAARSLSK